MQRQDTGKVCQVTAAMPDGTLRLQIDGIEIVAWHHDPMPIRGILTAGGHEAILVECEAVLLMRPNRPNAGWLGFSVALGEAHAACSRAEA
jgi:hypothetical protein